MGGRHLIGETTVALLRGINVGGARPLPMAELREVVAALGCSEVRSYIASGNLVFRTTRGSAIGPAIEAAIEQRWGYDVPVMIRTAAELRAVAAADPFSDHGGRRYVGFCPRPPDPDRLDPDRSPGDRWAVDGRAIYLAYEAGIGRSKLDGNYLESSLGMPVTVRNWNTVTRLIEMTGGA